VAGLPAALNITAADMATLVQTFANATPQQMAVLLYARALSQNWASMTASGRSADIVTYTNACKASPPATFGSSDLNFWILSNA
jgi:hypothetical protein